MVDRARTKDEMFMLRLYQEASKLTDMEQPIDSDFVGRLVGLQSRAVRTICTLLAQANFIKKRGEGAISITPHGIKLVEKIGLKL